MKIIVHRGTNEIGGTCVELQSGTSRILLDFGMPLVTKSGESFDFSKFQSDSTETLIEKGILPKIEGAYHEPQEIKGVIISHPHADHFGLMKYLNNNIPVYLGEATHEILRINNIFLNQKNIIANPKYFTKGVLFSIGDFSITPYWNDHSAFDSYSFLIEANGKRLFYSGDFRSTGRKANVYQWFLRNAPQNIDCLLIEGTTIGRSVEKIKTEKDIEDDLTKVLKSTQSINFVYTSSQNIDRLVSIYKACLRTKKTFVLDIYTAEILEQMSRFAKVPTKTYSYLKVLPIHSQTQKLKRDGLENMIRKFDNCIDSNKIIQNPNFYVIIVRPSMKRDIEKYTSNGGSLIYSMWSGYKKKEDTKTFLSWLKNLNFDIKEVHTSGHANPKTLKEFADALKPESIIPIHTNSKAEYINVFAQKIIELNDGELFQL